MVGRGGAGRGGAGRGAPGGVRRAVGPGRPEWAAGGAREKGPPVRGGPAVAAGWSRPGPTSAGRAVAVGGRCRARPEAAGGTTSCHGGCAAPTRPAGLGGGHTDVRGLYPCQAPTPSDPPVRKEPGVAALGTRARGVGVRRCAPGGTGKRAGKLFPRFAPDSPGEWSGGSSGFARHNRDGGCAVRFRRTTGAPRNHCAHCRPIRSGGTVARRPGPVNCRPEIGNGEPDQVSGSGGGSAGGQFGRVGSRVVAGVSPGSGRGPVPGGRPGS
ncbi:hypothetical protein JOE68_000775 [Saccharothrix algeriensis]|uniref:Uncharacterized protein n=1 Tax=Saccharothrix algeriensis TaxID=173560 RepID=A0ABS2S1V4_9PSEU|nr:hypothetical protein [Saccharothrix algeriensis]